MKKEEKNIEKMGERVEGRSGFWYNIRHMVSRELKVCFVGFAAMASLAFALAPNVWAQGAPLSRREAAIADIGAAVARGEQKALARALKEGFSNTLTLNESKEIIAQLYAYCGFPRALNAAATLRLVADDINPKEGPLASPVPDGDRILFGTAIQTKLCGEEIKGGIFSFIPQLDEYLKGHLFGDIFARDNLSWREREIATIGALAANPDTESQLKGHLKIGANIGLSREALDEIVSRVQTARSPQELPSGWSIFPIGEPNNAYRNYFKGKSYISKISGEQIGVYSITFEPSARNDWHIHHANSGGGQILIATAGIGIYQEEGKDAIILAKGDSVNIPANVKHWHGAAPNSWFQHLALEIPGEEVFTEWCGEVTNEDYSKAAQSVK